MTTVSEPAGRSDDALAADADAAPAPEGRAAPEREPSVAVVVVVEHHERLLALGEERRRAVARPLLDVGQTRTDRAHPAQRRVDLAIGHLVSAP